MSYRDNTYAGMSLVDYNLLRKYSCGNECVKYQYQFWKDTKLKVHFTLLKDELKDIFEKESIGMIFNKIKMPFKDVRLEELKPTRTGDNQKLFKQVMNNIPKILNRPVILNFYSEIGEQANMATTYFTEQLLKVFKGSSTNGVELNRISTDFNETNSIQDFLSKDFLTIFGLNLVFSTDYRKAYLDNLYEYAKLNNKPIICSSNSELKLPNYTVINLRLTDTKKTQQELITDIFGEK